MNPLINDKARKAAESIERQREDRMRDELAETDWHETPIVDIVWVRSDLQQTVSFGPGNFKVEGPKLTVERHESPAPPARESSVRGYQCEIQRVTRPLYEKMQREHPELF